MKNIKKQLRLRYDYDANTGLLIWKNGPMAGRPAGCVDKHIQNRRRVYFEKKLHLNSRLVWMYHYGDIPAGMVIDHIDRCPGNDKIENLRIVSQAENCKNKTKYKNNKSGCPGVRLIGKKWVAKISNNNNIIHLGAYDDYVVACAVRKQAEKALGYLM